MHACSTYFWTLECTTVLLHVVSRLQSGCGCTVCATVGPVFCFVFFPRVRGQVYLGRKVVAELEILEEGRHDDGGEKEDDAPEEDIRDIGPFGATSTANKLATFFDAVLQHRCLAYRLQQSWYLWFFFLTWLKLNFFSLLFSKICCFYSDLQANPI